MKNTIYQPKIDSYPIYGMITSLIPDDEYYRKWIINNFIGLRFLKNDNVLFYEQYRSLLFSSPYLMTEVINRETLAWEKFDVIRMVGDSIEQGNNVFLFCDRYYISEYRQFKVEHDLHELFIYGYDAEKDIFHCCDNLSNGKYKPFEVPGNEMTEALKIGNMDDYSDYFSNIYVIKQRQWWDGDILDEKQILSMYRDYVFSIYRRNILEPFSNVSYGFEVHYDVEKYLNEIVSGEKPEIRVVYVLQEHKKLMSERFNQLYIEMNKIEYRFLADEYKKLQDEYKVLYMMFLKNIFLKKTEDWEKVILFYKSLVSREEEIIDWAKKIIF